MANESSAKLQILTINIWGGHIEQPLLQFIQSMQDIDIFCLQEVYSQATQKISTDKNYVSLDIFNIIQHLLPNHKGYFRPVVNGIYGIAMFVRRNITATEEGEHSIYTNENYIGTGPTHSRILQYAKLNYNNKNFYVINVHGLWNGKGKDDSEKRINQSLKIMEFLNTINSPKILCGDFNLKPNTTSIRMLERDMLNLVTANGITSTRSSLYSKPEKYADYIFISDDIAACEFRVLPNEVSDHLPLLLEFIV